MLDTFAMVRVPVAGFTATGSVHTLTVALDKLDGSPVTVDENRPWFLTSVVCQGAVAVELFDGKSGTPFVTGPAEQNDLPRIPFPAGDVRYSVELPSSSSTLRPVFLHLERDPLDSPCEC